MTNRELEIFMAVVDCGKMSTAAQKLFITQSSVSQAIASIEKEYNVLLFERLSHTLYLTATGRTLLEYARNLTAVSRDMDEFLSSASGQRTLRIGATVTVGTCVMCPILNRMRTYDTNTKIEVSVTNTRNLEGMLLRNELDIALVEGVVASPYLISVPRIDDKLVLVCSNTHRFKGLTSVDYTELINEPLILRESGSGTRALFENQMLALDIPLNVAWNCSNSEGIINAVKNDYGISVISQRLVQKDVDEGTLWSCDINGIELKRNFSLVFHKNKHFTDEMKAFEKECKYFGDAERARS